MTNGRITSNFRRGPHACDICGLSGADHEKPGGGWIHQRCGMVEWQKGLAREGDKPASGRCPICGAIDCKAPNCGSRD